jgi:diadenosine tetraphosphatase ApaH/serine/threonine PP2A family protein phosphatase
VLGCLFDVHGNLPALEAVLDDARVAGVERFVLGGDYAAFGGWPAECTAILDELDAAVRIRGNWERWQADPPPDVRADAETMAVVDLLREVLGPDTIERHAALPPESRLGEDSLICHASPGSDMDGFAPEAAPEDERLLSDVDVLRLVFGHTHRQFVRSAGGIELINPGSVGLPLDGDRRAAWALLRVDGRIEQRRVSYDVGAAIDGLRDLGGDAAWVPEITRRLERAAW